MRRTPDSHPNPQDLNQGTEWRSAFPKFLQAFLISLIRDCWSPIQWALWVSLSLLDQMRALWSLYQVTVPTPLRLPPTSQRPDPSIMVMSAASGSLPAAHAFLHNNNKKKCFDSSTPIAFKLPVPGLPQRALFFFPSLLSTDSRLPQGKDWGCWGRWVGIESFLDSHVLFSGHLEKTAAQRGEEIHSRRCSVNGGGVLVEVRPGPSFLELLLWAPTWLHSLGLINVVFTLSPPPFKKKCSSP